jgi:Smg protein
MYDNMVDVLIYLYENYMNGDALPPEDHGELEEELTRAGFTSNEVAQALTWLDDLARRMENSDWRPRDFGAMRIFTAAESAKLDRDARGLLLFLEQGGILDPASRELVIDRAVAIEQLSVSVDELKWVVLLVLMNRPGREDAFTQMEELVYGDEPGYLH